MFKIGFWKDTLERVICTFCEALLGCVALGQTITSVDWQNAICISLSAAVISLLKCVAVQIKRESGDKFYSEEDLFEDLEEEDFEEEE